MILPSGRGMKCGGIEELEDLLIHIFYAKKYKIVV